VAADDVAPLHRVIETLTRKVEDLERQLREANARATVLAAALPAPGLGVAPPRAVPLVSAASPLASTVSAAPTVSASVVSTSVSTASPAAAAYAPAPQPQMLRYQPPLDLAALERAALLETDLPFDGRRRKRRTAIVLTLVVLAIFGTMIGLFVWNQMQLHS